LETRLRDKMKDAEQLCSSKAPPNSNVTDFLTKEVLGDLDGVTCEPTSDGSTKWNFHCDGASYPARLVNLPCPVEIHKTHDHAMYYKCCDVAQLLIVYEDEMALEEAEALPGYKQEDFPSYYHSGLTPPLKRVVERRFAARAHKAVPPPRTEVSEIEEDLKLLIDRIGESTSKPRGKNKNNAAAAQTRVMEEIVDDVVDYEPWMDDHGRLSQGLEFSGDDPIATKHPELWLHPREIEEILHLETEKEDKKKAIAKKKEDKKNAKKKKKAAFLDQPSVKKNVAAKMKMNMSEHDETTQAAAAMLQTGGDDLELLGADLDILGFDLDNDSLDELGGLDFNENI
jgi:transcription initiation factor TFIID subunit 7